MLCRAVPLRARPCGVPSSSGLQLEAVQQAAATVSRQTLMPPSLLPHAAVVRATALHTCTAAASTPKEGQGGRAGTWCVVGTGSFTAQHITAGCMRHPDGPGCPRWEGCVGMPTRESDCGGYCTLCGRVGGTRLSHIAVWVDRVLFELAGFPSAGCPCHFVRARHPGGVSRCPLLGLLGPLHF